MNDDDRIKVVVIGNSFWRDWVNVLLESFIADELDISYIYANLSDLDESVAAKKSRLEAADYVFLLWIPMILWIVRNA